MSGGDSGESDPRGRRYDSAENGGQGAYRSTPANHPREDLRLASLAVVNNWEVPQEVGQRAVDAAWAILDDEEAPRRDRMRAAEFLHNLDAKRAETAIRLMEHDHKTRAPEETDPLTEPLDEATPPPGAEPPMAEPGEGEADSSGET